MTTTLTKASRTSLLSAWIKPSSDNEKDQQDRAVRMVTDAIKRHPAFSGVSIGVYAKGSYANNTNVRRDSDVDIVVECKSAYYYDFAPGVTGLPAVVHPYDGIWTHQKWRNEVNAALINVFGQGDVDTSGKLAIAITAKPGSRPSIDVVPSFTYCQFTAPDRSRSRDGTVVYPTSGPRVVNWPDQQLQNGRAKNTRTGGRYKNYTRALKNAENILCQNKVIEPIPSYLMECLVWNVPDKLLMYGDLDEGFEVTVAWLVTRLHEDKFVYKDWAEPNDIKYLFSKKQKWTRESARSIALSTWQLMDYS